MPRFFSSRVASAAPPWEMDGDNPLTPTRLPGGGHLLPGPGPSSTSQSQLQFPSDLPERIAGLCASLQRTQAKMYTITITDTLTPQHTKRLPNSASPGTSGVPGRRNLRQKRPNVAGRGQGDSRGEGVGESKMLVPTPAADKKVRAPRWGWGMAYHLAAPRREPPVWGAFLPTPYPPRTAPHRVTVDRVSRMRAATVVESNQPANQARGPPSWHCAPPNEAKEEKKLLNHLK